MSTAASLNSLTNDAQLQHETSSNYTTTHDASTATNVVSGNTVRVGQQFPFAGDQYIINRSVIYFDLSSLGATIEVFSGTLTISCGANNSTTDFTIRLVDGSDAEDTLELADYGDLLTSIITMASNTITTNTWVNGVTTKTFNLNAAGVALLNGSTSTLKKFCLRSEEDINSSPPTTLEHVDLGTGDNSGYEPVLAIQYNAITTLAPQVTIQACTDIVSTTATGNGRIEDIGTSSVTEHGHCWNTTGNPTTSDSKTTNGAGSVGAFTSAVTGLTVNTRYYIRAYATNSTGTTYSRALAFRAGDTTSQMPAGNLGIVGTGLHYIDADGNERVLKGALVT